jgi:hypothetical protein
MMAAAAIMHRIIATASLGREAKPYGDEFGAHRLIGDDPGLTPNKKGAPIWSAF